jgi:hypothetical protein
VILVDISRRSLLAMSLGSVLGTKATLAQEATPAESDGDWPMPGANSGRTGAITTPGLTTAPISISQRSEHVVAGLRCQSQRPACHRTTADHRHLPATLLRLAS